MERLLSDINVDELKLRLNEGEQLNILDVREVLEYHTYNVGGKLLPLGALLSGTEECPFDKTDEIIVVCQRGIRSETACRQLVQTGFEKVRNLAGGLLAYRRISE
jgi:rhodanese-related sulfurtransferase